MSREWFVLTRNSMLNTRRDPLADPLEGEEWRGLAWVLPLLSRLAETRAPVSHRSRGRVSRLMTSSRHPAGV